VVSCASRTNETIQDTMIIHAATVELLPHDLRLLRDGGLSLGHDDTDRTVPVPRADLASRLRAARAAADDPQRRAILVSFLRQLRG
jgi:hypothetical protein